MNNRRSNLRKVNSFQNNWNARKSQGKWTSNFKGVHWDKETCSWKVKIRTQHKSVFIGRFKTEKEAALAYNEAVVELRPKNVYSIEQC